MTEQEIKKSIEKLVEEIVKPEATITKSGAEFPVGDGTISSGSPSSLSANGGKDKIKNDSPMTEEEKAEEAKKAAAEKDEKEMDEKEMDEKEKEEAKKAKMKKAQEDEKDEKKDDEKEEKEDKAKKAYPKPSKMKKSLEELAAHLDEEELELVKAWREEETKEETIVKSETAVAAQSQEELTKSLTKVMDSALEPLKKALAEKDEMIKSMNDKIQKLASQPAYDRRSISTLETLEKSGEQTQEISKSQVTEKMLALQLAGKGVTAHHIAEFEATRNISDPHVKALVFKELNIK